MPVLVVFQFKMRGKKLLKKYTLRQICTNVAIMIYLLMKYLFLSEIIVFEHQEIL